MSINKEGEALYDIFYHMLNISTLNEQDIASFIVDV